MIRSMVIVLLLILPLALGAQTAPLGERLARIIDQDAATQRSFIGVQVTEAETGTVLFSRNEQRLFTPASNAKLYTGSCALATWGADKRFQTEIVARGTIKDGVLEGNIVLVGKGDPVLTNKQLRELAHRVKSEWNLNSVTGRVIVDNSLFTNKLKGPGWMWDDEPDYYSMSVTPLMVDYNVLKAKLALDASGAIAAQLDPPSDQPPVVNTLHGVQKATVKRAPFEDVLTIEADGSGAFAPTSAEISVYHPAPWVAGMFGAMLAQEGVQIGGATLLPTQTAGTIRHDSVPLSEILALFNKPSENAIGEMLLLDLAVEKGTVPATWAAGEAVVRAWLEKEAGLAPDSFRLVDGSGLSRYDQITAAGTVQLLAHMWKRPDREVFRTSLPIAGVDGTIRTRFGDTPAKGHIFAKTGTMSGVSSISGYVQAKSGAWRIFSIQTNGNGTASTPSRKLQDQLCVEMMD